MAAAEEGSRLDLTGQGETWGADACIDADFLRSLLVGESGVKIGPGGVRLCGARILGRLDLSFIRSSFPISMEQASLEDGIDLSHAHLPLLSLESSLIKSAHRPAISAYGANIGTLDLSWATVSSGATSGQSTINLRSARVDHDLRLQGAHVASTAGGAAVFGDNMRVGGSVILAGLEAKGPARTLIRLNAADIVGLLELGGSSFHNDSGACLDCEGATIGGAIAFGEGHISTCSAAEGAIRLVGTAARQIDIYKAKVANQNGPAIVADGVETQLDFNIVGCAIQGTGADSAVRLLASRVGQDVCIRSSSFVSDGGPALNLTGAGIAADLRIATTLFRGDGDDRGTICMPNARIGGEFNFSPNLEVGNARVGLNAAHVEVARDLIVSGRVVLRGDSCEVAVRLDYAAIGGKIAFRSPRVAQVPHDRSWRLSVDGLTYKEYAGISPEGALRLLEVHSGTYAPQPFRQLAAVAQAKGHDDEARRVLIAQAERRARELPRKDRLWERVKGVTIGYGYRPSRSLRLLACVVGVAVVSSVSLGWCGGLQGPDGVTCSTLDAVATGLDASIPLIRFANSSDCAYSARSVGQMLLVIHWITQLLAWALATLFAAGFTGAIRRL